jgi:hypothetical protein
MKIQDLQGRILPAPVTPPFTIPSGNTIDNDSFSIA